MNNINQEITDMKAALASLEAKAAIKAVVKDTYTYIQFDSTTELAKALLDGREFLTCRDYKLSLDDTLGGSPFRVADKDGTNSIPMSGMWSQFNNLWEINTAPAEPWYLNIPEGGVECYVSDGDPNPCRGNPKVLVTGYDHILVYPFKCPQNVWKYATPVNEGIK